MQVILIQDVSNLGIKGELKDVAPGFARNHLFPRGLAVQATPQKLQEWKKHRERAAAINREKEEQAQALSDKLSGLTLVFAQQAGEGGRLFGSVTPSDIASRLSEEGYEVDKKKIELPEAIKALGDYHATVRLWAGQKAELIVKVEQPNEEEEQAEKSE